MPKRSPKLYKEAQKYLVGGVNSPLRAFGPVGGDPLFVAKGQGARIQDADGKWNIDYVGGYGPMILGHAHPKVISAIKKVLAGGTAFGTNMAGETELAKEISLAIPSIELLRLTNSGTEAVMGALKLAKALTKRTKVLKFKECYHGWSEQPYLEADYNDLASVRQLISKDVAAIIVEPVAGNIGVIPPAHGFLAGLRKIADENGSLLIFDEVITGFRVAYGGAQERFGVKADLSTLGKIIGGGGAAWAYGGRKDIMQLLAPAGSVYQAGTFSGNPVTVAAGLATLKILKNRKVYSELEEKTLALVEGTEFNFKRVGSMFSFVMNDYRGFFWKMIGRGVYFTPSDKEANFVSITHSARDVEETIRSVRGMG